VKFTETPIAGAFLIALEPRGDDRGSFARSFCTAEFAAHGLETVYVQQNVSRSARKGTLRGMHFQLGEHAEVKLIRCAHGAIYDVLMDIRPGSPSYGRWFGAELTGANGVQMYAPAGVAHGFITLGDDVEVTYLVSRAYAPGHEGGVRWNDPAFGVVWPTAVTVIAPKDETWPDFRL
jgi:dTDP-4-dehydrorhamnose 3,5-epimerase